jgi:5-methylcytosine-specific restriction endonuclease McrA
MRSAIELEVDHKVPVAQGGSDALDNLQTLCVDCNRGKRNSSE